MRNPHTPSVQVAEFVEKLAKPDYILSRADREAAFATAKAARERRDAWDHEHA